VRIIKRIVKSREFFLLIIIAALLLVLDLRSEFFFTIENLKGLMLNISVYGIVAAGITILFVSRGIDLSIGTVMATLGVVLGEMLGRGFPIPLVIILVLILGAAIGTSIGLLVTKVKINPFIVTLAYFFCFRGLAFILGLFSKEAKGEVPFFGDFPAAFNRIAGGTFYGVEYIIFYAIAIVIIYQVLLSKNVFFRQNFFLGGNEYSARVVGIKINVLKIINYMLVTTTGAIAIILRASRVQGTSATFGYPSFALIVITAVILGGGSLKGGAGSVVGSFLGVVLISTIYNAMIMLGINPYYTEFTVGLILLFAVLLDELIKKIPGRSLRKLGSKNPKTNS